MPIITILLAVSHRGQVIANWTFTREVTEVQRVLRLQYQRPHRRASSISVRSIDLRQRTVVHHSPRPERWHNTIEWVPGHPAAGWTEYLPEYRVAIPQAMLWEWSDLILPQNYFLCKAPEVTADKE